MGRVVLESADKEVLCSFAKGLFNSFAIFFQNELSQFSLFQIKKFFTYHLHMNPLSEIHIASIFPPFLTCFFTFDDMPMMSFTEKAF